MVYGPKRNPDRCPAHPGALLREDVIPATGKTKAEIAQFSAFHGSISTTFCANASRSLRAVAVPLGKLFGDGAGALGSHAGGLRYVHRRFSKSRCARVAFRLFQRLPSENRHKLLRGRAVVRGDGCASFAKPMRRAVVQPGLIAPIAEFVAETGIGERRPRSLMSYVRSPQRDASMID
jgi:hypothetical protein